MNTRLFFPLLAAICTLIASGCQQEALPPKISAVSVSVIEVKPVTVPVEVSYIAQARSSHQIEVMARVDGFLEQIAYTEGKMVHEGQVMFRLDRKPLAAQLEASQSEVEIRKTQRWVTQANLDRIKPLAEQDAASKSDLDTAIGNLKTAEAALAESQARLKKAELDLSYTTIKSPISGISGQSVMREGAYITAMGPSASLTYVAKLDPIWIEFSVSQNEMAATGREVDKGNISLPENQDYDVEVEFTDGSSYPRLGKLSFADPSFNQQTGTFLVRAELPNPEGVLRPGMFLKTKILGAVRENAVVIPQKAVIQSPNGHLVYVAGEKNVAEPRLVIVGDWLDENWIITEGLLAGDRVITDGLMKLAPGMPITIVSSGDQSPSAGSATQPIQ